MVSRLFTRPPIFDHEAAFDRLLTKFQAFEVKHQRVPSKIELEEMGQTAIPSIASDEQFWSLVRRCWRTAYGRQIRFPRK